MANNQTTAIAVTDESVVKQIAAWSDTSLRSFYKGRDFDGWKTDVALAIVQNKQLRDLLNNPADAVVLMRAVQLNASSGLSLNPQHGQAAIVAYRGKKGLVVNHLVMKNGLIKKAPDTKQVTQIESGTIFEKDEFKIKKTSKGDEYEWSPALGERGKPTAYFACVIMADGRAKINYMTAAQVWQHALKYGQGRIWDEEAKQYKESFYADSAWNKSFNGMAEKTVIRNLLNDLYLPELQDIFAEEAGLLRNVTPTSPVQKGTGADDLEAKQAEIVAEAEQPPEAEQEAPPESAEEMPLF